MGLSRQSSQVSFPNLKDEMMERAIGKIRKTMTRTPKGQEYCLANSCSVCIRVGCCTLFPQMFPKLQKIPKVHWHVVETWSLWSDTSHVRQSKWLKVDKPGVKSSFHPFLCMGCDLGQVSICLTVVSPHIKRKDHSCSAGYAETMYGVWLVSTQSAHGSHFSSDPLGSLLNNWASKYEMLTWWKFGSFSGLKQTTIGPSA